MNDDEDCQVEQLTRKPHQERCLCQPLTLPKANLGPVLTFPQYFLYRPFQTLVHRRHASDRQTDIHLIQTLYLTLLHKLYITGSHSNITKFNVQSRGWIESINNNYSMKLPFLLIFYTKYDQRNVEKSF